MNDRPLQRRDTRTRPRWGLLVCQLAGATVLWLGLAPRDASAWGRIGHRAAGTLAEARLTPAAREAVRALLEPGESLADASTWADEVRRQYPESGPWHYVNVNIEQAHYDRRFCPPGGCVVSKIDEFRRVVADSTRSLDERRKALRFLVHFLEDMHQPLHVGDRSDRGGNDLQVQFFGQGSNLHRVWDSGIVEHESSDESAWVREISSLATAEQSARWAEGTVESWADESLAAARQAYRVPGSDRLLRAGAKLGDSYQAAHLSVVRQRLAQAGVRVAATLNSIWK